MQAIVSQNTGSQEKLEDGGVAEKTQLLSQCRVPPSSITNQLQSWVGDTLSEPRRGYKIKTLKLFCVVVMRIKLGSKVPES